MNLQTVNFDTAFDRVISHEGGYSNHKDDPGGETMWGVTAAVARANGYSGPMKDLSRDVAKRIYRARYWNGVKGDALPPAVAFQAFDAAVNHGVLQACKWLQAAVGVAQDGMIGPVTLKALTAMNPAVVVLLFNSARLYFYPQIDSWPTFGRGWINREATNLKYAAEDLKCGPNS